MCRDVFYYSSGHLPTLNIKHFHTKILVRVLKSKADNETLKVHEESHQYLTCRGFEIKLHIMENETSRA